MKQVFLRFFLNATAATGGAIAEPTSEKLTELKAQYKTAWAAMMAEPDPFSEAAKNAKMAVWKLDGEIKAELANIQKLANDAKLAEQRNQRLALVSTLLTAHADLLTAKADKKTPADKLAELETAFNTAKEVVDNELLAKYAASRPAKVASEGGEKPAKDNANTAAIVELFVAGKTHKEIEEMGYKRSTVWHAINNYKKANNLS